MGHTARLTLGQEPRILPCTITFAVDVVMPSGLNQISVGVMDERSQQTGFERVEIRD